MHKSCRRAGLQARPTCEIDAVFPAVVDLTLRAFFERETKFRLTLDRTGLETHPTSFFATLG